MAATYILVLIVEAEGVASFMGGHNVVADSGDGEESAKTVMLVLL